MTEFYNILDKIDLEEKEMLNRNASKKIGAAENLILDRCFCIYCKSYERKITRYNSDT